MYERITLALAILVLGGTSAALAGPEPWADPKLPVKDGLAAWYDATRAWGNRFAPADGKLADWLDASGNGRHLKQATEKARPVRLPLAQSAVVRFDGLDDHLRGTLKKGNLQSFTLFTVVATHQNPGSFRGILAFNAPAQDDHASGINIDLGSDATPRFSVLNVEGRGFSGAKNLRKVDSAFGTLHTLEVAADGKAVQLMVDGKPEGQRPREGLEVSLDEITLGARHCASGTGPRQVSGFCRCDLVEVLLFDRVLTGDEAKRVRDYLNVKHASLRDALQHGTGRGEVLVPVPAPPRVQVFVPGFTVRELPIDLTNINNVKYREDGTLVALGYDGRVWLLRDTNGDGIEDKATRFWDNASGLRSPIGMDLTPPGYSHGEGVFVVGKTRCVLIVDTNKDGTADKEIEVAGGWKESFHQVDGLGVAFNPKDGSVYYGRGTYNFADPLLRDKDGKPHYSRKDESGAIIRVAPDFKTREIIATGIRFPVGLRVNRHGDLFCTDQEGATWVPNGNPLDELLHIQKGRHYGFPPRHPKYVPDVIDEPSTFDYGPQHQSTCGFCFNEPVKKNGPIFGPPSWAGDAFVTGYSRGKLYRTQLVKTASGYVATTRLFACLDMLAVDCCVAPDGSLVVAVHSGGPDWGSGPTGKGKLYKIRYTDQEHPQPVLAWPAGPREVRIEFDRPVNPQLLHDVLTGTRITAGQFVRAGDRFESLRPGYAIVEAQKQAPRFNVPIRSAQLTSDRRTLVLATDPLSAAVHYAITLPGMARPALAQTPMGALPQYPQIDLDFDLSGCAATWKAQGGTTTWAGWLPHPDLRVAKALTVGSGYHDTLWKAMEEPGSLTLQAQLHLTDMLRPAVQPGSRLDYELPDEKVTLTYETAAEANMICREATSARQQRDGGVLKGELAFATGRKQPISLEIQLRNNARLVGFPFSITWYTNEDNRERPLQLHRALVPWADTKADLAGPVAIARPKELEGGSWARGRRVFHSEQAACSRCHTLHGQGGEIGPDLSNLVHRDYSSVLRDIAQPSFAINPDYIPQTVLLKDERTLLGVVRERGGKLQLGDKDGKITVIDRSDVASLRPSARSIMPDDLLKKLGPESTRDLLTFLLTAPPSMPRDYTGGPRPKPRTVAEVNAVLAGAPNPPEKTRLIRVVLVAGPKDHGKGEHDYPAWQKVWKELLAAGEKIDVATAWEWPDRAEFQKADVMVFYQHGDWTAKRAADIDAFLERGGGLVYLHWAVDGRNDPPGFARRIGLASKGGAVKFRHGPLELYFNQEPKHPVVRNFDKLALVDESYWPLIGNLPKEHVIGWATEEKEPRPLFWSLERARGRVFVSIPGHYSWTFDDPLFRVLLLRGMAWAAREPVDRFNDLVWPGADVMK